MEGSKVGKLSGNQARQEPREGTPQDAITRLPAVKKLCVESHPGGISDLCFVKGERELLTLQWCLVL